ncbi:MAG: hypothetical protein KAI66_22865, partial [Lentisphaeria bacterium]|nr:hypothetical protein [Lentisphaeria bacterium]
VTEVTMKLITVDMEETTEIDLYVEHARITAKNHKAMLKDIDDNKDMSADDKTKALAALNEAIDAAVEAADAIVPGEGPMLTLRYINAAKMTGISFGARGGIENIINSARKACALGVAGWSGVTGSDGNDIVFSEAVMLDSLERSGMLSTAHACVLEYNSPSEEVVKK